MKARHRVILLGATGSVGRQALEVCAHLGPERLRVVGLSAHRRAAALAELATRFRPVACVLTDPEAFRRAAPAWRGGRLLGGPEGVLTLLREVEADRVLHAMVGAAGVAAAVETLRLGRDLCLANKESLVVAGPLLLKEAARTGARILPVDSEHAALFQLLDGRGAGAVRRLLLTGSGGPFRESSPAELARVTPAAALRHPVWKMGRKITVDSATLMNKALEVIEARWLFGVEPDRIEVVIHPQGIVHSLVEFVDGNVLAQMALPDMRVPIQYALTYPERLPGLQAGFDLARYRELTFEAPDPERFPALALGFQAARRGGTAGAALNAANEVAVRAFLAGRLSFAGIAAEAGRALEEHPYTADPDLETLLEVDREVRRHVERRVGGVA